MKIHIEIRLQFDIMNLQAGDRKICPLNTAAAGLADELSGCRMVFK